MAKSKKEAPPAKRQKNDGDKMPSRDERAMALMERVNIKNRGRAQLMAACDYDLPYLTKRLPTGLLTLDVELRGGFPAGGISQIIGRKNAGKSWMVWQVIRQLQAMLGNKMKVLLAMTEIPADRSQARLAGVKISMGQGYVNELNRARRANNQPVLSKAETDDLLFQIGQIDELHALSAEDFYDVILQGIEQNVYHLIVIDSIGNVMSAAAQENESVHDKTYAGSSGPNTVFLQQMTNLLTMKDEWGRVRDTCLIGVNQVRDNIKDPNKNYKAPGGNSLEHAKLLDIYVESGGQLGNELPVLKMTNEGMKSVRTFTAYGKTVNWKIEKGKAGMHEGGRGQYSYIFDIGTADFYTDTIIAGLTHGIIEGSGWYNLPHPTEAGKNLFRVQGRDNLIKILADDAATKAAAGNDDESYMNYIRNACFQKAGININYEWADS